MDLVDLVVECLESSSCYGVIDVGCGGGDLIEELSVQLRSTFFVGVDIDPSNIGPRVYGVGADAAHLPFRDRIADVMTAKGLLHHVEEVELVLNEMARVVASDGWLFISEATRFTDVDFADMNRELLAAGLPTERHPGFDPDRLAQWVSHAGLSVARVITDGVATFATPPFVSRTYSTTRVLVAAHR